MDPYQPIVDADAVYVESSGFPRIDIDEDQGSLVMRTLFFGITLPLLSSWVGMGEFFSVAGKKKTQAAIGAAGYLRVVRALMIDLKMLRVQRAEPIEDRFEFEKLAAKLLPKHSRLGGADVWHMLAAINAQRLYPNLAFFTFDSDLATAARSEGLPTVYGMDLKSNGLAHRLQQAGKYNAT